MEVMGDKPTVLILCKKYVPKHNEASTVWISDSYSLSTAEFPLCVTISPLQLSKGTQRWNFVLKRLKIYFILQFEQEE